MRESLNKYVFSITFNNCDANVTIDKSVYHFVSIILVFIHMILTQMGARCSSVVRAFAHGAMGHRIDPSWGGPIELFLVPASAPRLV